jgi:hypothetical protein
MFTLPEFHFSGFRLFQSWVVETFWTYPPDEDFSRNASCVLNLKSSFLFPVKLKKKCAASNSYSNFQIVNLISSPTFICSHACEDCVHLFFESPIYNENKSLKKRNRDLHNFNRKWRNLTPDQNIAFFLMYHSFSLKYFIWV